MINRIVFLFIILITYCGCFSLLDNRIGEKPVVLQVTPPLKLLRVVTGYLYQVTAELFFVKTSVFLGGVKPGIDPKIYEAELAQNLTTITALYPEFIDPYYYAESFLAPISLESAKDTNLILEKGIRIYPDNFILRFFYAFNLYRYLDDPLKAAEAFEKGAEREGAPPMFGHLAAIFSAHGGNLTAGMIMLQTMLRGEKDEFIKQRYKKEIEIFQKAIAVQNAISFYKKKYNTYPEQLSQLVPEFLIALPVIKNSFILVYNPPELYLKRP